MISPYVIPGLKMMYMPKDYSGVIIEKVCEMRGITRNQLMLRNRKRERVLSRFICMWMLRKHTHSTLSAIGRIFNMDHTTVIHAMSTLKDIMETEPNVLAEVLMIEHAIQNGGEKVKNFMRETDNR